MVQLIRTIKPETKIITRDGELQVSITLDLNINLTTNGGIEVTAQAQAKKEEEKKEDTQWAIPDFGPSPRINFGKKE